MSDLVVLGLKLLFLALLWLFVLFALSVIRTDLFGRRVPAIGATPAVAAPAPAPPRSKRRDAAPRPPTHLRVTAGPQVGLRLPLGDSFLIGRTSDAQLVLEDAYMSTRHAVLSRTAQGYQVEDLGSTNGTFLNETRLAGTRPIALGDTLRIGRTTMTLDA